LTWYFALSVLCSKYFFVTRGDAFRCASRLPLANIFRAFGADALPPGFHISRLRRSPCGGRAGANSIKSRPDESSCETRSRRTHPGRTNQVAKHARVERIQAGRIKLRNTLASNASHGERRACFSGASKTVTQNYFTEHSL